MLKRIYEWITKTNQVLLFFAIIGAAALILFLFYDRERHWQPPSVPIAQTTEEAKKIVILRSEVLEKIKISKPVK
jgi:hypothetical protein